MTRQQRVIALLQDLLAVCQKHDCAIDGEPGYIRLFDSGDRIEDFYIQPDYAVAWIGLNEYYVGKQNTLPLSEEGEDEQSDKAG